MKVLVVVDCIALAEYACQRLPQRLAYRRSLHRTIWNDLLASSPHASILVIIIIIIIILFLSDYDDYKKINDTSTSNDNDRNNDKLAPSGRSLAQ